MVRVKQSIWLFSLACIFYEAICAATHASTASRHFPSWRAAPTAPHHGDRRAGAQMAGDQRRQPEQRRRVRDAHPQVGGHRPPAGNRPRHPPSRSEDARDHVYGKGSGEMLPRRFSFPDATAWITMPWLRKAKSPSASADRHVPPLHTHI